MDTATDLGNAGGSFTGDAKLFKLSRPVTYETFASGDIEKKETSHVIVSAIPGAFDTGEPETYIFPADDKGKLLDWGELEGSFQGGMDHAKALNGLGFEVLVPATTKKED